MSAVPAAAALAPRRRWRPGRGFAASPRALPEEVPVSLSFSGCSFAVMMATPDDLEDFAVGFTITEGLVRSAAEIEGVEIRPLPTGVVLDITLDDPALDRFRERRRYLAGPAGCGLCGLDSIAQAVRPVPRVCPSAVFAAGDVAAALAQMPCLQRLHRDTRAVHAAALWRAGGMVALREDVGRHNALDKLAGALCRAGTNAAEGLLLLTSRVSIDLIQKAAVLQAGVVVAVSVPTGLAVRAAEQAGITLVGVARDDGFEVFSHPARIVEPASVSAG